MNVYKITNTANNQVYIGITSKTLTERFSWHTRDCRKGEKKKLYDAMRQIGEDKFNIEFIEKTTKDIINEREEYYIELFDSYRNGYNASPKSSGIYKHTEESKKIMSEKAKGRKQNKETRKKQSEAMKNWWGKLTEKQRKEHAHHKNKGHKHTKEFRDRCRQRQLGQKHSKETKQKMKESHIGRISSNFTEIVSCPYCKKTGKGNAMLRWHFDRCKEKPNASGR